jgi:hypothetical protein
MNKTKESIKKNSRREIEKAQLENAIISYRFNINK